MTKEIEVDGAPFVTHLMYNYEFVDDFDDPKLGALESCIVENLLPSKSKQQTDYFPIARFDSGNVAAPLARFDSGDTTAVVELPSRTKTWGPNEYDKQNHTMALMVRNNKMNFIFRCHSG